MQNEPSSSCQSGEFDKSRKVRCLMSELEAGGFAHLSDVMEELDAKEVISLVSYLLLIADIPKHPPGQLVVASWVGDD